MTAATSTDWEAGVMWVEMERLGRAPGTATPSFGYGVVKGADGIARRVLARVQDSAERGKVAAGRVLAMPADLPIGPALAVPVLSEALRAWNLLRPELGSAVVVSQGTPWSPLMSLVGRWHGGTLVPLGGGNEKAGGFDASDADLVSRFARVLEPFPSVCVIELSGRAEIVDVLFEAIRPYARVLLAGPKHDRFTIDYYLNVHRKGIQLTSTVLDPVRAFEDDASRLPIVERAIRLLSNPARASACLHALEGEAAGSY